VSSLALYVRRRRTFQLSRGLDLRQNRYGVRARMCFMQLVTAKGLLNISALRVLAVCLCYLVASFALDALGLAASQSPTPSFRDHIPEVERLRQSHDWVGLERLAQDLIKKYDALGRRASKTVTGLGTTTYLLDGDEEIAEYSGATVLRHYVTGPGVDDRIAHAEGSSITSPTKTYYHTNHQGSVMAMTDGSGNLTQRIGYDEYGNGSPATGEQFGYTGRRYDPET
jgi:hypothetical protein